MPNANAPLPRPRSLALMALGAVIALPLARGQRPLDESEKSRPPTEDIERELRLAEARLELHILEGRIGVKQAQVKAEDARLASARQQKKTAEDFQRARLGLPGAIEVADIELLNQEARHVARKAELDEATALYEEAKRRLDKGWIAPLALVRGPAETERRLGELERSVEQLLLRVEKLSRKSNGSKTGY